MASEKLRRNMWTSEMEGELINLVEAKSHLWDIQSPLYTKKTLKQQSYCEIAEYLKSKWPESEALFNYDAILRKFQNLRTYYKREKNRAKRLKSGSGCDGFTPKWEHFRRLGFLDDGLLVTESSSNLDPLNSPAAPDVEELENLVEASNASDECSLEPEPSQPASVSDDCSLEALQSVSSVLDLSFSQSPKSVEVVRKRKRKSTDKDLSTTAYSVLQSTAALLQDVTAEKETENEAFAQYVKTALDNITDSYQADLARRDIMDTLIKYKHNKN